MLIKSDYQTIPLKAGRPFVDIHAQQIKADHHIKHMQPQHKSPSPHKTSRRKKKKLNATNVTFTGRPHQTSGALKTRPPRRTSHRLYKGNVFQLTFTDCLMSVVARRQLKESTLTFLIASFGKQKKVP